MSAVNILKKAAGHLKDRAATYDKPNGQTRIELAYIYMKRHPRATAQQLHNLTGIHIATIREAARLYGRQLPSAPPNRPAQEKAKEVLSDNPGMSKAEAAKLAGVSIPSVTAAGAALGYTFRTGPRTKNRQA